MPSNTASPDRRPPIVLHDVARVTLAHVEAARGDATPFARLHDVVDLTVRDVDGVADGRHARIAAGTLPTR